jgi:hypothetical protein
MVETGWGMKKVVVPASMAPSGKFAETYILLWDEEH